MEAENSVVWGKGSRDVAWRLEKSMTLGNQKKGGGNNQSPEVLRRVETGKLGKGSLWRMPAGGEGKTQQGWIKVSIKLESKKCREENRVKATRQEN